MKVAAGVKVEAKVEAGMWRPFIDPVEAMKFEPRRPPMLQRSLFPADAVDRGASDSEEEVSNLGQATFQPRVKLFQGLPPCHRVRRLSAGGALSGATCDGF